MGHRGGVGADQDYGSDQYISTSCCKDKGNMACIFSLFHAFNYTILHVPMNFTM